MSRLLLRRLISTSSHHRYSNYYQIVQPFPLTLHHSRAFSAGGNGESKSDTPAPEKISENSNGGYNDDKYPKAEFVYKERNFWERFKVKTKLLVTLPWERFEKGSILKIKLGGEISDQLKSSYSRALSLPQICDNFEKAAYDPRVVGIYIQIESLSCGWGKLDEIWRSMSDFKKSGKFIVGYVPVFGVKEYYIGCACDELYAPPSAYVGMYGFVLETSFVGGVLEKVGIEPQVARIGKYKSLGDQLTRKSMSDENREMLTALLENIYGNWLDKVSAAKGKKKEDVENLINEGSYKVKRLKDEGWITDIKYDDEVISMLRTRWGVPGSEILPTVSYRQYCSVRRWTLGLNGSKDHIAIIRASGSISRSQGKFRSPSSRIVAEQFIDMIHRVAVSKKYKAVIIRINSPGGDALASDLMWREINLLAITKPVIVSMADVAASGGYYMAMGADAIVAEKLTLTGSIGVVSGKPNMEKLYEYIGFNKETISRGKFAELATEHRPFRTDEAELFSKKAEDMYTQFRDKAAMSRSMTVENMENAAQGRVWTGNDAASLGLVDAIGGLSRAVAIAKQKANIPLDKEVTLVELSGPSPWPLGIMSNLGSSIIEVNEAVKELVASSSFDNGIQARMDGILLEKLEGGSFSNPVLTLIKDHLRCF